MPKTIRNVFFSKLNFLNLLKAEKRASLNKGDKKEILLFHLYLETNLNRLLNDLNNETYKVSKYKEFKIFDPKERTIRKLPYVDRVVHQWYVGEFIKPYIANRFINDSYACIDGKGAHKAVKQLQKYMRIMKKNYNNYYIVKFDIKKFFENIDKGILLNILNRYIKDERLLKFTKKLIYENNDKSGIPLGNYTSQYFANIYLNELDYFVKHKKHIKYYIRYMDDFVLLVKTKKEARSIYKDIEKYVNEQLKLELNKKSRIFPNHLGINFLGYKLFETHILLSKRNKLKMKKQVKIFEKEKFNEKEIEAKIKSWHCHIKHCNSYNLKCKINRMIFNIKLKSMFVNLE